MLQKFKPFMKDLKRIALLLATAVSLLALQSCGDDPKPENIPEIVTRATLRFAPAAGSTGSVVTVTASDPDRDGPQDIRVDGPINLAKGVTYTMTISLINELVNPNDDDYDIAKEVQEEADEHMFFFSWTNNVFSNPTGNGNIDNRADAVNYNDRDDKGQPLGISTNWTTATTVGALAGKFKIILKHQPEIKSATSRSTDGETDLEIEFDINMN
jgi:hypothetical protein